MGILESVVLRLVLWVVLPLALIVLLLGPKRVWSWLGHFWSWLSAKRLDPEQILTQVVRLHEKHIAALRQALARSETAEADITRNIRKSQENLTAIEDEAGVQVARNDDLGARPALYKLSLA